jgi:hypothetical protein
MYVGLLYLDLRLSRGRERLGEGVVLGFAVLGAYFRVLLCIQNTAQHTAQDKQNFTEAIIKRSK